MTQSEHRSPLAPGEIRRHTVGAQHFQVMHVMNGGMTQTSVTEIGKPSRVLCTDAFASTAVRAYADAIEQAELDAADALDGEDEPMEPLTAEGEEALRVRAGFAPSLSIVPQDRTADGVPEGEQDSAPASTLADDVAALQAEIEEYTNATAIGFGAHAHALHRSITTRLDRIAGAVPQRATDADEYSKGDPLWLHECGGVMPGQGDLKPDECPRHWCIGGTWRALYTLGGE